MAKKTESTATATQTPEPEVQESVEKPKGTTSILFPELTAETTVAPSVIEEKKETPEPAPVPEVKYLDDFSYKVKTKIGGEEGEVTVEELKRGYQTAQFLTKEGQRLAEERRKIEAEKAEIEKLRNPDNHFDPYSEMDKSEEQKRLERIEKEFSMVAPILGNIKYQEDLKVLDIKMRQEGLEDFMKTVPAIEQFILNQPIEQQESYKSFEFYEKFYKTEKIKELKAIADKRRVPDERPKPNVMSIETGSIGVSSEEDDGYSTQKQQLYSKAVSSGKSQDWQSYFSFLNKSGKLFKRPD